MFCYDVMRRVEINDTLCVRELGEERRPISTHICGVGDCPGVYSWRTGDYSQVCRGIYDGVHIT